ncbi:MAG TPA: STAS domain-containing protein [Solirubrobacteraceae bacterium]|nr:STAS domain-containing protein [Solirubrobacteraceae bacterium]
MSNVSRSSTRSRRRPTAPGARSAARSRETLPRSSASPSQRCLSAEFEQDEGRQRLALSGELDMATAPDFEQAMLRALGAKRPILLDLTRLSFIDSAGLWAITLGHTACRRRGIPLSIVPGVGAVREVFEATGLFDVLPFEDLGSPA